MNNKEILENAPEGWTHYEAGENHYFYYLKVGSCGMEFYRASDSKWFDCSDSRIETFFPIRSRADIERIVELEEKEKTLRLIHDYDLSIKKFGTWFGVYLGDSVCLGSDDCLAYDLDLSDAVRLAVLKLKGEERNSQNS